MTDKKQIRIKDIAQKANVSAGTVDRVLHHRGEVAEKTKKKILKIIHEFDYKPNYLASTLASRRSAMFVTFFPQPPSSEGYWNKPIIGVKRRQSELIQYGIQVKNFTFQQNNSKSFVSAAEKIRTLKPDGVILAPFFKKEALIFAEQLKNENIPFIFIDSEIKNAGQLGYIGQDSFQSGVVSGKLLDSLQTKGNILVIHFAKEMDNQNHLLQREMGFYDWFRKNSKKDRLIYTLEIPDNQNDLWMEKLKVQIKSNNIGGIFVTNSKVFLIGRFVEKFKIKNLRVIGHDLLKENVQCLKKEIVDFLICQRPEEQGYNAINKLFRYVLQKNRVSGDNYTSIDIVMKENINYYYEFKNTGR